MALKLDVEILDRCLQRIQTHASSLEECLREYPDQAAELRPLLAAAVIAHRNLAPARPTEAFRSSAWKRLAGHSRERPALRPVPATRRRTLGWRPAYTLASMLIAVALLAGTVGVAYASGEALPGDSLYSVKRGLERAALALTASHAGDTRLLLQFADRRLGEADELLQRGREADLAQALEGYESAVAEVLEIAAREAEGLDELSDAFARHAQVLQDVLEQAPDPAKPGLNRALERSHYGMDTVEKIRKEKQLGDIPPGQLKKTPGADDATRPIPAGQLKKTAEPEN
ncbi:MAG: DUF5667 domain-containing protein [Anaerolineales bacterium]